MNDAPHTQARSVYTLGAYDRFNYGDLLFPLVLDYAAEQLGYPQLTHVAPKRSDLSAVGARPTVGSRALQSAPDGSSLILGGGEVLGATWGEAASSVLPTPLDYGVLAIGKVVPKPRFDDLCRRALGGAFPTPYVPDELFARRYPVVANAIGASSLVRLRVDLRRQVVDTLAAAAFVSVRDSEGAQALASHDVSAELAPDSVAILQRLRPKRAEGDPKNLVVQASRAWLGKHESAFASSISSLAKDFESIELLPIGLAGGHGDAQGLSSLLKALQQRGVTNANLLAPQSVWAIADVIAQAKLFVGTSLHGAITSSAYGVPHVGLAGINKLSAYLQTWGGPLSFRDVDAQSVAEVARSVRYQDLASHADHASSLADTSWQNTERVLAAANDGPLTP